MKEYSVAMAVVDFVPVILYGFAVLILQKDLYNMMSRGAFAMFAAGTINVLCAGAFKALYKLLFALNICDFQALSNLFFPMQSLGLLLSGIGILSAFLRIRRKYALAVAPPLVSGTLMFVVMMVIGLGCTDGSLVYLSRKLGKKRVWILFVLSFVCCLTMGYLSTKDFDKAIFNWITEAINVAGQGMFLAGTFILHRAGLGKLELKEEKAKKEEAGKEETVIAEVIEEPVIDAEEAQEEPEAAEETEETGNPEQDEEKKEEEIE